jgi:geranylgeranyl pyrophosphate synthase
MLAMEDGPIARELSHILQSGSELGAAKGNEVVELVRASRGPQRALERARELSSTARNQLDSLTDGEARDALAALTNYVVSRKL